MPQVLRKAHVSASIDSVWRQIGAFQNIGEWHPMLAEVTGRGESPGALRRAKGRDGQEQVERLLEMNPAQHFYRYEMVSTPMPVKDYTSELRAEEDRGRGTVITWTSDFTVTTGDEAAAVQMIDGFLAAGLENLKKRFS